MLRVVVVAALMIAPAAALAGPADDALVNCLIAKATVSMAIDGEPLEDAYPAAWGACDREATAVPAEGSADLSPRDAADEHAYRLLQDIAENIHPGYTIDGELGAEY